jgi:4-hydroxybenzoate polyprenyltransferase
MKNEITAVAAMVANNALVAASGADIRDEVSAWVTLIGSIAITLTTIGIQVYHLIRDRDKDKKNNQPADAENEDKENDEKNG